MKRSKMNGRIHTRLLIAYSPHPVEIQAGFLEPRENSVGIPYIRHFVIVFPTDFKALFYITRDFFSMITSRCDFPIVELDNFLSPGC